MTGCLSRMRGDLHVRFLGEERAARLLSLPDFIRGFDSHHPLQLPGPHTRPFLQGESVKTGSTTTPPSRVLMVACDAGIALPAIAPDSPFGPFTLQTCDGLDAAAQALSPGSFDAVLVAARTVDARRMLNWPGLSLAATDPALLVLTTDEPGAELAVLLARHG